MPDAYCLVARPSEPPKPVIIDTDIGSYIDDSYAISFSLQSSEYLDVKLIVTYTDDTTARAKVAAKLLTIYYGTRRYSARNRRAEQQRDQPHTVGLGPGL